jgi:nickel transport protein
VRYPSLAVAALLAYPTLSAAHQTLHEVRRGGAVAVRVYESDGDPVAGTAFEVYSPADPGKPWQIGRTDRTGWLAFVPEVTGRWRVRVIEASGHGLDIGVEVAPQASPPGAIAPAGPPSPAPAAPAAGAAFILRPLLGLAVIGVVFAALFLAWRKKNPPPAP